MARRKNTAAARGAARSAAHTVPAPAGAPAVGPSATGPVAAVVAALAAHPGGATTAGIAAAAGISRAAVGKALASLEAAGAAERTKGARPGIPDTWRPAATAPTPPPQTTKSPDPGSIPHAEPASTGETAAGPAAGVEDKPDQESAADQPADSDGAGSGNDEDEPGGQDSPAPEAGQDGIAGPAEIGNARQGDPSALERAQDGTAGADTPDDGAGQAADSPPGEGTGSAPDPAVIAEITGHATQVTAAAQAAAAALAAGDLRAALAGFTEISEQATQARRALKAAASGRKAPAVKPGALRELVAAHLRAHPGKDFGPHEIGKVLGRSSGAVANALDRLTGLGEAELSSEKPRRFRLTGNPPAGDGAAAAPAGEQAGDRVGESLEGAA